MQAINDYVIIDKIKEEPKKVSGLILTDETDKDNRYKKANIVSVGNEVKIVKEIDDHNDKIFADKAKADAERLEEAEDRIELAYTKEMGFKGRLY